MRAERYVRPPLVAREPADPRLALWCSWLFALVALAVAVLLAVLAVRVLIGSGAQDTGTDALTGTLPAAAPQVVLLRS